MANTKIVVIAHIMTDRLFAQDGYDVEQSAYNLADLQGEIITEFLAREYPETEVYVDIGIHRTSDRPSNIEVEAYVSEEATDQALGEELQNRLARIIVDRTADYAWAVKAGQA